MDAILKTAANLLPYHLLSYGALLGTELYQSFVNTKLCYKYLPPREFLTLQKRLFPVYFGCQVGLAALAATTRPPYGVFSFIKDLWGAVPLVVVLATGSLNWFVFGPRTITAGLVRLALNESREVKSEEDVAKVHRANRMFVKNHAMSIHLNAIALIATVWYGFSLSLSLRIIESR